MMLCACWGKFYPDPALHTFLHFYTRLRGVALSHEDMHIIGSFCETWSETLTWESGVDTLTCGNISKEVGRDGAAIFRRIWRERKSKFKGQLGPIFVCEATKKHHRPFSLPSTRKRLDSASNFRIARQAPHSTAAPKHKLSLFRLETSGRGSRSNLFSVLVLEGKLATLDLLFKLILMGITSFRMNSKEKATGQKPKAVCEARKRIMKRKKKGLGMRQNPEAQTRIDAWTWLVKEAGKFAHSRVSPLRDVTPENCETWNFSESGDTLPDFDADPHSHTWVIHVSQKWTWASCALNQECISSFVLVVESIHDRSIKLESQVEPIQWPGYELEWIFYFTISGTFLFKITLQQKFCPRCCHGKTIWKSKVFRAINYSAKKRQVKLIFWKILLFIRYFLPMGAVHLVVSKIQWKPFWLATQLYPQNDWTGWQNRVNYDVQPGAVKWGLCEYVIVHTILGGSPVIVWISLGGKPKWLPLKFGYHDVMCTSPIGSLTSPNAWNSGASSDIREPILPAPGCIYTSPISPFPRQFDVVRVHFGAVRTLCKVAFGGLQFRMTWFWLPTVEDWLNLFPSYSPKVLCS